MRVFWRIDNRAVWKVASPVGHSGHDVVNADDEATPFPVAVSAQRFHEFLRTVMTPAIVHALLERHGTDCLDVEGECG